MPSLDLYTVQGELREEKDRTVQFSFPHPAWCDRQHFIRYKIEKWHREISEKNKTK